MTKVEGCEGSYSIKKTTRKNNVSTNGDLEKGTPKDAISTSKFIVKFYTGWDEERGTYTSVRKSVNTEAEATALIVNVNSFVKEQGGDWSKVRQFLDKDKKRNTTIARTLDDVFREFVKDRRNNKDLAKRTVDTTVTHLKRAYPFFSKKNIRDITVEDARDFLHDIRDADNPLNKRCAASGTYAEKIYATLKQLWEFALDKHYVDSNIFKNKNVKAPKRDTEEKDPLTIEEVETIMGKLLDHDMDSYEMGIFILMTTGARLSEMLALRWSEYNESTGVITIKHSMERDTQDLKPTKTNEVRSIPLMPAAQKVLLQWRDRQKKWYKKRGLRWSKKQPICQNKFGVHFLSSNYGRWWRENRQNLGVPDSATLHTMRHTFATTLIVWCGVDTATVQALTGHTNPDVLLQIYTHSFQNAKAHAMEKLGDVLFPYRGEHACCYCKHWSASPDPANPCGACWAKANNAVEIFDGSHVCSCGKFELKVAA